MDIGDRIRARRLELNMSQDDLARAAGYKSRSSINKIEMDGRGLPQKKVVDIARVLKVTPAYLMGWEDDLYIDEDGAHRVADLDPVENEIIEKVHVLRPDFQRMALSLIDNLLEMQQNADNK